MGSDLPSRDTFISTCGPVKSNAAACALAVRVVAHSAKQTKIIRIRNFRAIEISGVVKNTTGSLSGLGVIYFFAFEMHRATDYSAPEIYAAVFRSLCPSDYCAIRPGPSNG
jgi:hypothetical protein